MTRFDQLDELRHRLDAFRVYDPSEIEAVVTASDRAEILRRLDSVVDRFRELYEPAQEEFHGALSAFVELYSSLRETLSNPDRNREKLYTFGELLLARLPTPPEREKLQVAEEVTQGFYQWTSEAREKDLLRNVHRGLPPEMADRYQKLLEKRRAETLSASEHAELIRLTDARERLQAERVASLAELARLRRTSLSSLAGELGFQSRPNA